MIERGPWYYFIPPMQDYVPEIETPEQVIRRRLAEEIAPKFLERAKDYQKDINDMAASKPLIQIMLDEDEAGKRNG